MKERPPLRLFAMRNPLRLLTFCQVMHMHVAQQHAIGGEADAALGNRSLGLMQSSSAAALSLRYCVCCSASASLHVVQKER